MKHVLFKHVVAGCMLASLLLSFGSYTFAQLPAPDVLWSKTYGEATCSSSFYERVYDIKATDDGNFIIAGNYCGATSMADILLVKMNGDGDFLWTQTYGGSLDDIGMGVQQTSDGGYIITGATKSYGAGNNDVFLLKTDTSGDSLWMKTYGGVNGDGCWSVEHMPDGGYFMAAGTESFGAGDADIWLIRTDANGDTLWTKTYGGSGNDANWPEEDEWTIVEGLYTPDDNGFIVASYTNSFGDGDYDMWLLKTDAAGDTLWTNFYGGPKDELGYFIGLQQTNDGGYVMATTTYSFGLGSPNSENAYLIKTDASGKELWTQVYGGIHAEQAYAVQHTLDGGFFITAMTTSFGMGAIDCYFIRTDSEGNALWTKTVGGAMSEICYKSLPTQDGCYLSVGATWSFGAGEEDCYIVKLAPDPNLIHIPDDQSTIQAGINAAHDGDLVLVDDGTYYENINFKGKAITVASRYFVDGDTSHIASTIIDGSQPSHPDSGSVVYFISGEDTTSVLYGFTITNGTGTLGSGLTFAGVNFLGRNGGGIHCYKSGASILYNHIFNNSAIGTQDEGGGGISAYPDDYHDEFFVLIKGNRIMHNTARGGNTASGGGIGMFCDGKVIDNTIAFNTCEATNSWAAGGGVQCVSDPIDGTPPKVTFSNNTIASNSISTTKDAAYGGGLFLRHADMLVQNNRIEDNTIQAGGSYEAFGAGITVWTVYDETYIDGNWITHNSVEGGIGKGGGVSIGHDASPQLTNNLIAENSARSTTGWGGGIYIDDESYATIINNTICRNVAKFGGGLYMHSLETVILNTIVWDNEAESDPGIRDLDNTAIVHHSDIQGGWDGETNLDTNPLFEGDTFYLSDASPCIGTGIASIDINGVTYTSPGSDCDCRRRPYPSGSNPDMGAFESKRSITNVPTIVVPDLFSLAQNHPNPFNPRTTIAYDVPKNSHIRLVIYDVLGRRVTQLINEHKPAGHHNILWNGTNDFGESVAAGLYFCRMEADGFSDVIKLALVR